MGQSEEMSPVISQHVEVLIALSRMEGKVDAFASGQARHDDAIVKLVTDNSALRDRVTALESSRSTPWYTSLGAIVPTVMLILVLAERLYSK